MVTTKELEKSPLHGAEEGRIITSVLEKSLVSSRLARKSGSSSTIDKQTTVVVHECVIGAENTPLRRPMFLKALINADLC